MALLKRHFWPSVLWVPLLIFFALPNAFGQEEELLLDNPDAYVEKHRPAVLFPHELHMGELDCLDCHHDYDEDGENVLDEDLLEEDSEEILCGSCHDAGTDIDLKKAFHRQCMGCHRELRMAGSGAAPELCGECHIK
jgi:c(7)-type cytochrome triheme protein